MPIILSIFIAIFNLGLSFLFNSPSPLNFETPLALAATKKINKNSSIAELFKLLEQFIDLKLAVLLIWISPINSPFIFFFINRNFCVHSF